MEDENKKDLILRTINDMKGAEEGEIMAKLDSLVGPADKGETRLCACGYRVPTAGLPIVNTGVVQAMTNVCTKCTEDAKGVAHLCCSSCKEVFVHVNPFQEKTGFCYEAGKYYHTMECPQCSKSEGGAVVEKIIYYKKKGVVYEDGLQKKIVK